MTRSTMKILSLGAVVCVSRVNFVSALANQDHGRTVVVGKVIIDEYGSPDKDPSELIISVGGGGPQAAWGAAAALAAFSQEEFDGVPPPQPVCFFGPVGQVDWTEREEEALQTVLGPAIESIHLIEGPSLRTPRIQLWHDAEQNVLWKSIHNSFGEDGADELWRNRPSADDILKHLKNGETLDSLHLIMEMGAKAAGGGEDALFLSDRALVQRINLLGAEPVAFADKLTGEISPKDAQSCAQRLKQCSKIGFVSPDDHLHRALKSEFWQQWNVAVRKGPDGSSLYERGNEHGISIPAASLNTLDGKPIAPTGAGNAYASALTTLLGKGASLEKAGCIATAIGAVVCEYNNLPPWTCDVITRIRTASEQVSERTKQLKYVS